METQITLFIMFGTFAAIVALALMNTIRNANRAAYIERGIKNFVDQVPRMNRHMIRRMCAIIRRGSTLERMRQGFGPRGSGEGFTWRKRQVPDEGRRRDIFNERIHNHRLAFNQPEKVPE